MTGPGEATAGSAPPSVADTVRQEATGPERPASAPPALPSRADADDPAEEETPGVATSPAEVSSRAAGAAIVPVALPPAVAGDVATSAETAGTEPVQAAARPPGPARPRAAIPGSAPAAAAESGPAVPTDAAAVSGGGGAERGEERTKAAEPAVPELARHPAAAGVEPSTAAAASPLAASVQSLGLPAVAAPASAAPPALATGPTHPVVEGVPISGVPVEIGLKSLDGIRRFDIRLAPEDLGGIDVRLDIAGDGRVSAHLLVDKRETMQWLQRDSSHLERALDQAGLRIQEGGISVVLRDPSGGGSGSGRPDGGTGEQGRPQAPAPAPEGAGGRASVAPRTLLWSRASGIDLRI